MNPLSMYYAPGHVQAAESPARMDMDASSSSAMSVSAASPDCMYDGRASSVSLDDPDVRLAAEALGDLRAGMFNRRCMHVVKEEIANILHLDFVSSPPNTHSSLPANSPPRNAMAKPTVRPRTPEPLLSLLTTSHPLLATTIEGGISAYNSSKNYSPRFKSGAEYVEGYVGPIANTLGSVGRVTGVEGGVRWILGGRRQAHHSDLEAGESMSNKRRKMETGAVSVPCTESAQTTAATATATAQDQTQDPYVFKYDRRLSMASTIDTLPAYEEKSPAYTETADGLQVAQRQQVAAPWQSRLLMSTSGLSVAMSEESLRSLKYCLTWLRWANDHISRVINSLKTTLEQYEQVEQTDFSAAPGEMDVDSSASGDAVAHADRRELAARITTLKGDVLKTLKDVIDTVSKYAGGALPENARVLVRRHLTSLPRKWQLAMVHSSQPQSGQGHPTSQQQQQQQSSETNMKDGAQRVLVLAKEGLDMMAQVSLVLDGTINSAEEWCDRLGRRRRDEEGEARVGVLPQTEKAPPGGDVKMG
jgi:transcriptional repressor OPI1